MEKGSVIFAEIVSLAMALGIYEINKFSGCWEHQVDADWYIAFNGHLRPQSVGRGERGIRVEPYHCYVEFNGFPAGQFSPYGEWIAYGAAAKEDALIEALRLASAKERRK